jgi:hypothetical protein
MLADIADFAGIGFPQLGRKSRKDQVGIKYGLSMD